MRTNELTRTPSLPCPYHRTSARRLVVVRALAQTLPAAVSRRLLALYPVVDVTKSSLHIINSSRHGSTCHPPLAQELQHQVERPQDREDARFVRLFHSGSRVQDEKIGVNVWDYCCITRRRGGTAVG